MRTELISYLSVFPYINKPSMLTDFNQIGAWAVIYYLLSIPGCILLLLLITGKFRKKKKAASKAAVTTNINTRRNEDMFCQSCDASVDANIAQSVQTPMAALPSQYTPSTNLIGFSGRYHDPEILAAANLSRKRSIGCMWILVLVPLIGFPMAGLLMENFPLGEAIIIGIGIALVMLIVNLFALRSTKKPIWEGVVINKYNRERRRNNRDDDSYTTYTEFTVVIQTNRGKKKHIVEEDSRRDMYDYLAVGDRVSYHPTFATYEKYDKSKDRIIYCNVCRMMNPIENDRCKRCKNLLFK